MKKQILAAAIVFTFLVSSTAAASNSSATQNITENISDTATEKPDIVFFYSPTCPHCDHVEEYIQGLNRSKFNLKKYKASTHSKLFSAYIQNHSVPARFAGAVHGLHR